MLASVKAMRGAGVASWLAKISMGVQPAMLPITQSTWVASIVSLPAAVKAVSMRALGVDASIVNVNGGAIALGHPVGMSGARIVLHLALELQRRGGGTGAAALCGGGGQGDALLIRVPS